MAGRIPQNFIDELLDRVDIVEVVDRRVPLKKAGKNYKACCPFHNEKTPSFNVSADKQYFHCFGCGAGGNAISFVMDFDNVDFPHAIELLAGSLGMEVPREQQSLAAKQQQRQKQSIYDIMQFATRLYQQALRQHKDRQQAVDYLKQRGLSGEIARDFGIGFAPPGWDNLLKAVQSDPTYASQTSLFEAAGLLVKKDNDSQKDSYYDRFRHRIMFPIRDNRGRIIAFGGRVLGDDKPKYLNSPETSVFHKQRELYGLYEARRQNNQLDQLVMVEGYMDVVSLFQYGINYAVATLGTASSAFHLEKIFRHTARLVVCFDGDEAGQQAADRLLDTALPAMQDGREIAFLFLPEGQDPDTYVRDHGKEAFEHALDQAKPLEQMLFEKHQQGIELDTDAARVRYCRAVLADFAKLPAGLFRQSQIKRLAQQTQTDVEQLAQQLQTMIAERQGQARHQSTGDRVEPPSSATESGSQPKQNVQQTHTGIGSQALEQPPAPSQYTLLGISSLLHYPELAGIDEITSYLKHKGESKHSLYAFIELVREAGKSTIGPLNTAKLYGHIFNDDELSELASQSRQQLEPASQDIAKVQLLDALQRVQEELEAPRRQQQLNSITQKPPSQLSDAEREILRKLGRD